jgi:hypothetical protein
MAVKNIQIPSKKGQGKPLEICEFEQHEAQPATTNHFLLNEIEMKKVAEKMASSLGKKKRN